MEHIKKIVKSYQIIKEELDKIDDEIRNSEFATDSDLKPPAHNLYTNLAIFVVNVNGEAARIEPDIIEAEFALDPDMQKIDRHVENIQKLDKDIDDSTEKIEQYQYGSMKAPPYNF